MTGFDILFYILSGVALGSAIMVISQRNPVHSALWLVLCLFSIAGLYLTLHAEFLAAVQVLTYAGAILVLFIFIIMLLNLHPDELKEKTTHKIGKIILALTGAAGMVIFGQIVPKIDLVAKPLPESFGSVTHLGKSLFTTYVLPFEIAGVLLTVALIGAVLLAKRDLVKK